MQDFIRLSDCIMTVSSSDRTSFEKYHIKIASAHGDHIAHAVHYHRIDNAFRSYKGISVKDP